MVKDWSLRISFVILGLLIPTLIGECLLRFSELGHFEVMSTPYPQYYFQQDDASGFDITNNFSPADFRLTDYGRTHNTFFKVWANDLGCFDDPYKTEREFILLVGDSFTWGYVPFEDTWGALLQRETRTRILKCGVGGFGTRQEGLKLEKLVQRVGVPDVIVIGYCIENDLLDDYLFPLYTVIDGYLVTRVDLDWITGEREVRTEQELKERLRSILTTHKNNLLGKLKHFMGEHSVIYNLLRKTEFLRTVTYRLGMADPPLAPYVPLTFQSSSRYSWLDRAWEEHLSNISKIQQLASKLHTRLLFVLIPSVEQVYDFKKSEDEHVEWNYPNQRLRNFFEREGIAFLDLLPKFRKYTKQTRQDLYWSYDRHLNVKGNRLAGLLISEHVLKHTLIDSHDLDERLSVIKKKLAEFVNGNADIEAAPGH